MTTEESTKNRAPRGRLLFVLPLALMIAGTIQIFAREQGQADSTPQAQRAQGEATAESEVETAYVAVLDKNGNPVTDLKREDFSISENNARQEIVEVASAAETPLVIAVVVDVSGSTRSKESGGEEVRALTNFLSKRLKSSDKAFVTMFADRSWRLTELTNNLAELQGGLKKAREALRHGPTALYDCLVSAAATMSKEPGRRKVILAMSDFEDNVSFYSLKKTVLRMQETGTAVFPLVDIAGEPQSKRGMNQKLSAANVIAKESGGAAYVFEKPQGLETALELVRSALRNSYVVKYHATEQAKKGRSVGVKIEVQRGDVVVIAAKGRVAAVR